MSWTRYHTVGFEMNTLDEVEVLGVYGSGSPSISTTEKQTGTYSLRGGSATPPTGKAFRDGVENLVRSGLYLHHNGLSTGDEAILFVLRTSPNLTAVLWDWDTDQLQLMVDGVVVAYEDVGETGITTTNVWHHLGISFYNHASAGWFSVYLEGEKILTYVGDTDIGGAVGVWFGGRVTSFATWANYYYIDDWYIDIGSSEADEAVPSFKYLWAPVDGDGAHSDFSINGAATNYQCVDDTTPDGDTTYVYAEDAGIVDFYTMNVPAIPSGYVINGLIVSTLARRTNAGIASALDPSIYRDTYGSVPSASVVPTTVYKSIQGYFLEDASGALWTEANLALNEIGYESSGTY